jgi:predicted CopG family antitoxin
MDSNHLGGLQPTNNPKSVYLELAARLLIRVKHVHLLESGLMQKKLTITLDETVYDGLHRVIGRRRISRFIEELVRPYILAQELEAAYQHMAQDETREAEALAWSETTVSDVSDAAR